MPDIARIPFTEMFERVKNELIRDADVSSTMDQKYKGRINDTYMFDMPAQVDWRHYEKTGSITTVDDYSTGYITAISSTTVTGDADCVWTSAISNNMLLKVSGYDELYRVTYSSAIALTLDRTWLGDAIVATDTEYSLFQDRYALATDFDRMPLNADECVYYWQAGNRNYLTYVKPSEFETKQSSTPATPQWYTIMYVNNAPYIYIDCPADSAMTLKYNYMPKLARMREYTTGVVTDLALGGTAITGSGTAFNGFCTDFTNYQYYFRLDRDGTASASQWYPVVATNLAATVLTLGSAYEGATVTGGSLAYTVSMTSVLPAGLDLALIYGACVTSSIDQDNQNQTAGWSALYTKIVSQYRSFESNRGYGKQRMKTIYQKPGVRK